MKECATQITLSAYSIFVYYKMLYVEGKSTDCMLGKVATIISKLGFYEF